MNLKIEVTTQDFKDGIPKDGCKCPVALAINRKMRERFPQREWEAVVGIFRGAVYGYTDKSDGVDVAYDYGNPPELGDLVMAIDHHDKPEPCSFTLTLHKWEAS